MSRADTDQAALQIATQAVTQAVAAASAWLGRGGEHCGAMDAAATTAVHRILTGTRTDLSILTASCEGSRDSSAALARSAPDATGTLYAYCDPLDGTLNGARGGPRCYSLLALSPQWGRVDRACADAQSVFSLGSNTWDVSAAFDADTWEGLVREHLHDRQRLTASLHRADNLALLAQLGGPSEDRYVVGSRTGYRPTLLAPGCLLVGDATVTLPWECDLEVGRMGLTEVQVQSALYSSWRGLIVSRDRVAGFPAGPLGYLRRYLCARDWGDNETLTQLFTVSELAAFAAAGLPMQEVVQTLTPDRFGLGRGGVLALAALSSPADPALAYRPGILDDPEPDVARGGLRVDVLTRQGAASRRQRHRVPVPVDTGPFTSRHPEGGHHGRNR